MASPAPPNAGSAAVHAARIARQALRRCLLADREQFAAGPDALAAHDALTAHLVRLLREIEPEWLGIYWPVRGEFNAIQALEAIGRSKLPLALPYAQREPHEMHYRAWNGLAPEGIDECGLPSPGQGPAVVPDVVVVPCVGYTRTGFRLGYGGGYFDRWLARHPHATAIGVAWSIGEVSDDAFAPQAHDRPLTLVLTERGVVT
jgi:5-formyltetrahydrofolate cyclo-ligase